MRHRNSISTFQNIIRGVRKPLYLKHNETGMYLKVGKQDLIQELSSIADQVSFEGVEGTLVASLLEIEYNLDPDAGDGSICFIEIGYVFYKKWQEYEEYYKSKEKSND